MNQQETTIHIEWDGPYALSAVKSLTVLNSKHQQLRVRLAGIDAPERGQPFSARSHENLTKLVRRQVVVVQWRKKDRYGRLVGTVSNGIDAGFEQLRAGLAWHYKRYEMEQAPEERVQYSNAERDARARRIGLWQEKEPVPPWEWRQTRGNTNDAAQAPER